MSKKKKKSKGVGAASTPIGVREESHSGLWPAEFVPLRKAALTSFCVAGWGLILAVLGMGNELIGLKQAGLILAGARVEPMLLMESLHSLDIAAVLFAFVLVLGAGYIHVSLGLAVLLAIAPWRDGFVYNVDNYYFLWAAMLLLGIWGLRQWMHPKPIHGKLPLVMLVAFWSISALTGFNAIQYDSTRHELLLWVYYGVVLFLAANAGEGQGARAALLCGFLVGIAGQAVYAYPYLYYLMPFLRESMGAGSALLADHFDGLSEATPEIAQRFNRNRAAGSMVHANALAALLILGFPVCLALSADGWRAWRNSHGDANPVRQFRYVVPWALVVFSTVAAIVFFVGVLKISYRPAEGDGWFSTTGGLSVLTVLIAGAAMGAFLFASRARGLDRALIYLRTVATTLLAPAMLGALWLTYSRGAMLALVVAVLLAATLVHLPPGIIGWLAGRFRTPKPVALGCQVARRCLPIGRKTQGLLPRECGDPGTQTREPSYATGLPRSRERRSGTSTESYWFWPVSAPQFNSTILVCLVLLTLACLGQALPSIAIAQVEAVDSAPAPSSVMTEEGIDVEVADLANPATLLLRLSYWRVAVSMACDNWLTGVGMGNFKFAYPQYQYLGAGDVQNAHNGFLQAWCETGVFGACALIVFWGIVLWAGGRRLRAPEALRECRLELGLLVGILAYLLHALLDMNLNHPTLVVFAMAATGLLMRLTELRESNEDTPSGRGRVVAVVALALAVVVSGIAMRPYLQHLGMSGGKYLHVGDTDMVQRRYRAAEFFLTRGPAWAGGGKQGPPPELAIRHAVTLLSDRTQLFSLGRIVAFDPRSGRDVVVPEEAGIPPHARFQLVRPWDGQSIVFDKVLAWLGELERIDGRGPYSPEHALTLCSGYKLLAESAGKHHADIQPSMVDATVRWGKEAVRRSPRRPDVYQMLGWAHWTQGTYSKGAESLEHFKTALAAFTRSTELAPNTASYYLTLSETTNALGQSYANAGQGDASTTYVEQSRAARAEAERIWRRRGALGLP